MRGDDEALDLLVYDEPPSGYLWRGYHIVIEEEAHGPDHTCGTTGGHSRLREALIKKLEGLKVTTEDGTITIKSARHAEDRSHEFMR